MNIFKRFINWAYWRWVYNEDDHNRRVIAVVTQQEATPFAASVILGRVEEVVNGRGKVIIKGVAIYSGRGRKVLDMRGE